MSFDPDAWHRRSVLAAMAALVAPAMLSGRPRSDTRALSDPFALGVASGDPASDGFVIWTRLIGPMCLALGAGPVPVRYEVAEDQDFRHIVRAGASVAQPSAGHSVHVELFHLRPGRAYWYRFHALGASSRTGRAVTSPRRADRLRLAVTSCQHWEQGYFGAYRDMVAAQPDVILQLGDYIYEQSYPDLPRVRSFNSPEPQDLAGYRRRHALYRTDPDLQAAHAAAPWIVTWDDHEVLNDYAGLANRQGLPPAIFAPRRAAAYQAYFEHMPIRPSLWRSRPAPRLFRGLTWGDLASLSVLDTRQYRSAPPCSPPEVARNTPLTSCADVDRPDRSIMGPAQEAWLAHQLATERRPWTLVAQQVFFAPLALDGDGRRFFSDQWDGYAANRARLLDQFAGPNVRNPVVLSGDVHSFWVNELRRNGRPGSAPVGTEIVTSALAAASPPAGRFGDAIANNPHIKFSDVKNSGYALLDIRHKTLTGEVRAIGDCTSRDASVTTIARLNIEAGERRVQIG